MQKLKKAKRSSSGKKIALKWNKDKTVKGYQIKYSTDIVFKKNVKNVVVKKNKTTSKTISKGINKKKTYYIKMRSFVKVGNTTIYGPASKTKKVAKRK